MDESIRHYFFAAEGFSPCLRSRLRHEHRIVPAHDGLPKTTAQAVRGGRPNDTLETVFASGYMRHKAKQNQLLSRPFSSSPPPSRSRVRFRVRPLRRHEGGIVGPVEPDK